MLELQSEGINVKDLNGLSYTGEGAFHNIQGVPSLFSDEDKPCGNSAAVLTSLCLTLFSSPGENR
ncbi:hypothetical protein [Sulfuracidifex metallicus]|uniref:hypothetical protein n=1 Tax=Sulfuracidifex metallicus TaxID=47303 RepID=UPI000A90F315|nr:hypothetical protein [Sulfuracidifex metallicus]WOE51824.1 hypothetical protein RQ359_001159 [Sulfuracidifex metallicus DSM 6482 = JCM 9184]